MTLGLQFRCNNQPEVPCKVWGLEGNQIRGKNTTQEMLPDRETAENFRRREGYMEEESDWSIGECFANHR